MGLDWTVGGRSKAGHENEFRRLFREITASGEPERPPGMTMEQKREWRAMRKLREEDRSRKVARFQELSIGSMTTLNAPVVGRDPEAEQWAREEHSRRKPDVPLEEWLEELKGTFVPSLIPACDGIPKYSNFPMWGTGNIGRESFRAAFLCDCVPIIGEELLQKAFTPLLGEDLVVFGKALGARAIQHAKERGIDWKSIDSDDPESDEFKIDVVVSAAKWCVFWGSRGHFMEPNY